MRGGIDPVKGVELLKERLITLQLHDLDVAGPQGADVPWGSGAGQTEALLRKLHELRVAPVMVGLEYSRDWLENEPAIQRCIAFFNQLSLSLGN
jgi:sugar phosphate isomerase/epimerase